jgi:hypothetical protein
VRTNFPRSPRLRLATSAAAVLGSLFLLAGSGGCTAVGAMAYKFSPPPTVPAHYTPAREPTVVFVQRSRNPSDAQLDAERIARYVTDDLRAHGVGGPMLDSSLLIAALPRRAGTSVWAAAQRPATATAPTTAPVTVADLGRTVGAAQVIYVDLTDFNVERTMASEMIKGEVDASVWVIDAHTGRVRWPTDTTQGFTISVPTPYLQPGEKLDENALRGQMDEAIAGQIARLFYSWNSEQVDSGSPIK